jgi:hypothetical protein
VKSRALAQIAGGPVFGRSVRTWHPGCARGLDVDNLADPKAVYCGAHELIATLGDRPVKLPSGELVTYARSLSAPLVPQIHPLLAQEFWTLQHDRCDRLPDSRGTREQVKPVLVIFTAEPDAAGNAVVDQLSFMKERGDGLKQIESTRIGAAEPNERDTSHPAIGMRAKNARQRHYRCMGSSVLSSVWGMPAQHSLPKSHQRCSSLRFARHLGRLVHGGCQQMAALTRRYTQQA